MNLHQNKTENIDVMKSCLRFVNCVKVLGSSDDRLSPTAEYCRLSCVFLSESFDEPDVQNYLFNIFQHLMKNKSDIRPFQNSLK